MVVTGLSYSSSSSSDYATIKYAPDGTVLWERRYDGPGHDFEEVRSLVIDNSGNIIVVGYSNGGISGGDIATIKYAPDGTLRWEQRYNGPDAFDDVPFAVKLDNSGNVIVPSGSMITSRLTTSGADSD